MVSVWTILCCVITLLVSLVLPVVILAVFTAKHRKQGIISAWFLGAAGFFVTQILIRVPILTVLQNQNWFVAFSQNHLFFYAFCLAFTAGLFELAGRFAVAKLLKKKHLDFKHALAAGLGHGGIEAMILIGGAYISNLAMIAMINSGTFDPMLAETAALGVDVTQLEQIREQLVSYSPALFLLGGVERILAMICHAAMSMLVCYGIAHNKVLPCTLICLGIHVWIDLTAGLGMILPQATAYCMIYAILIVAAGVSLWIMRKLHCRWQSAPKKEETL